MSEEIVSQCICPCCSGLRMENAKLRGACKHMAACRALLGVPDDEVLYVAIESLRAENERLKALIDESADRFNAQAVCSEEFAKMSSENAELRAFVQQVDEVARRPIRKAATWAEAHMTAFHTHHKSSSLRTRSRFKRRR